MSPPGLWRQARLSNDWPVKLKLLCNEVADTGRSPSSHGKNLDIISTSSKVFRHQPASWHFPALPWTVGPAKLRCGSQVHVYLLLAKSLSCLPYKMREQNRGEAPFLVHNPTVHPVGIGQVSIVLGRRMGEWVIYELADPFALESQHAPSDACWCSPKTIANSSPTNTRMWETSQT